MNHDLFSNDSEIKKNQCIPLPLGTKNTVDLTWFADRINNKGKNTIYTHDNTPPIYMAHLHV